MDKYIGSCFYRGVTPTEIKQMTFSELQYWHNWHTLISKTEMEAAENGRKAKENS